MVSPGLNVAVSVTGELNAKLVVASEPLIEDAPEPDQAPNCQPDEGVAEICTIELASYHPLRGDIVPPA